MKLIGTLFCLLLAAQANAVTQVEGVDGAPVEVVLTGGAIVGATVVSVSGAVSTTVSHVEADVVMPTFPASGATTALDSTVKESAVAAAGDDLFPVGYEVDTAPVAGSLTNGDYARPKLDARGSQYMHGGEIIGTTMSSRGIGVFGALSEGTSDQAGRPMMMRVGAMNDAIALASPSSTGPWISASVPLLNLNGLTAGVARYGRGTGTPFSISGGESGFSPHVKIVNEITVDSVEDIIVTKVTPVIFSATAYIAERTVGNVMEFTGSARVSGQGGIIHTVTAADDAGQNAPLVIWFFSQSITPSSDTQPIAISEGDMENFLGQVSIAAGNYESVGTGSSAMRSGLTIAFQADATSIFAVMKTKGTPNWSATDDLTIGLGIGPD